MEKVTLAVDYASLLLSMIQPPAGPGLASSFRRSQAVPTLRAICSDAVGAPERRILTKQETSQIAASAYRRAGLTPLHCTASELATALGVSHAIEQEPMEILFTTAGALLGATKATGSVNDQCILMLELAAPHGLMESLRIVHQSGGDPLPALSEVPPWARDLLLGRRHNSGIVRAIGKKSAV